MVTYFDPCPRLVKVPGLITIPLIGDGVEFQMEDILLPLRVWYSFCESTSVLSFSVRETGGRNEKPQQPL